MHSNDLKACGKKCCYFWFHSDVKFLTLFDVFLDLGIFAYFNATSIYFHAENLHLFCVISMLISGKRLI